jgi:hypothetical protein
LGIPYEALGGTAVTEPELRRGLVDIRSVHIDKTLPKRERVAEYVRQIKDPYHFVCGKFTVTAVFDAKGPSIEECLQGLVNS